MLPFLHLPLNTVLCRPRPGRLQSGSPARNLRTNPRRAAMAESVSGTQPFVRAPEDRLDSWKEIAAYLSRDVTTVQRWEKREAMPVHRHQHDRIGSVYAFSSELDAWVQSRRLRLEEEQNEHRAETPPRSAIPT